MAPKRKNSLDPLDEPVTSAAQTGKLAKLFESGTSTSGVQRHKDSENQACAKMVLKLPFWEIVSADDAFADHFKWFPASAGPVEGYRLTALVSNDKERRDLWKLGAEIEKAHSAPGEGIQGGTDKVTKAEVAGEETVGIRLLTQASKPWLLMPTRYRLEVEMQESERVSDENAIVSTRVTVLLKWSSADAKGKTSAKEDERDTTGLFARIERGEFNKFFLAQWNPEGIDPLCATFKMRDSGGGIEDRTTSPVFDLLKKALARLGFRTASWIASKMIKATCGQEITLSEDRQSVAQTVSFAVSMLRNWKYENTMTHQWGVVKTERGCGFRTVAGSNGKEEQMQFDPVDMILMCVLDPEVPESDLHLHTILFIFNSWKGKDGAAERRLTWAAQHQTPSFWEVMAEMPQSTGDMKNRLHIYGHEQNGDTPEEDPKAFEKAQALSFLIRM